MLLHAYKSRAEKSSDTRIEPAKPIRFEKKKNMTTVCTGEVIAGQGPRSARRAYLLKGAGLGPGPGPVPGELMAFWPVLPGGWTFTGLFGLPVPGVVFDPAPAPLVPVVPPPRPAAPAPAALPAPPPALAPPPAPPPPPPPWAHAPEFNAIAATNDIAKILVRDIPHSCVETNALRESVGGLVVPIQRTPLLHPNKSPFTCGGQGGRRQAGDCIVRVTIAAKKFWSESPKPSNFDFLRFLASASSQVADITRTFVRALWLTFLFSGGVGRADEVRPQEFTTSRSIRFVRIISNLAPVI
jgi:hypothetical protein